MKALAEAARVSSNEKQALQGSSAHLIDLDELRRWTREIHPLLVYELMLLPRRYTPVFVAVF